MGIAFRRSIRQLLCFGAGGFCGVGSFFYFRDARIFHAFQGGDDILPAAAAVGVFLVAYFVANTLLKGDKAR